MYLKRLKINNFRKFGTLNNEVEFVDAQSYEERISAANVASTTTLIVGRNNAGKTTIVQALYKLVHGESISSNDFNYFYLKKSFEEYKCCKFDNLPVIEFAITIGLDKGDDDYVTNLAPFMLLEDISATELTLWARYELLDAELFIDSIKKIIVKKYSEAILFSKFLEVIDSVDYKVNYYNRNSKKVDKFHLKDLIDFVMIKANKVSGETCLSDAFNKIIKYRYQELFKNEKESLEDKLIDINRELTKDIKKKHTKEINSALRRVVNKDDLQVMLSAELTFQKLMQNLVKYEYIENGNNIPENQFGLGYTNLMMIIANLIDYMEKYPDSSFNSKINLIGIEEPEAYMHPQMQELFINYINDAIFTLLSVNNKNVNSQLIVTTHSTHILNSKVHTGGSFNNINYVTVRDNHSIVINLNDKLIAPNSDVDNADFKFIKKHIKFRFSDLFFADAAILVEGVSEYTLLPYYLERHKELCHRYITILNINGAHGLVYNNLIKLLGIPTLIITDLDIKRTDKEKNNFLQVHKLIGRETTNNTIISYNPDGALLEHIPECLTDINIYIAYQNKEGGCYPTSFEEAFISKNYDNAMLNGVLKDIKPNIYKEIVGDPIILLKNKKNSFKWQMKLSDEKSEFSNNLLYEILTKDENIPVLPKYIQKGFSYLSNKLKSR